MHHRHEGHMFLGQALDLEERESQDKQLIAALYRIGIEELTKALALAPEVSHAFVAYLFIHSFINVLIVNRFAGRKGPRVAACRTKWPSMSVRPEKDSRI